METNKQYDEIVLCIMNNIMAEANRTKDKIVLWDFQPNVASDKLYYNIACIVSDCYEIYDKIYLQMSLIDFFKFKRANKNRKNLRWISRNCRWLTDENKTSVYIIMDFVRAHFGINESMFADINKEYYGD